MYTLYNVHIAIQCTHCTFCTMYTLYKPNCWKPVQLYCVHTQYSQAGLPCGSLLQGWAGATGGPWRGQLTASPATRWEGPLGRVLLPFPCFQGFPALEGLGKQLLPGRGQCCLGGIPSKTATSLWHLASYITWLTNQRSPIVLQTQHEYRAGHGCLTGWLPRVLAAGPLNLNFL
jgi:hypothetical protein